MGTVVVVAVTVNTVIMSPMQMDDDKHDEIDFRMVDEGVRGYGMFWQMTQRQRYLSEICITGHEITLAWQQTPRMDVLDKERGVDGHDVGVQGARTCLRDDLGNLL